MRRIPPVVIAATVLPVAIMALLSLTASAAPHSDRAPALSARAASGSTASTAPAGSRPRALLPDRPTLHGIARNPAALDVLVNRQVALPQDYRPGGLIAPDVPFVFSGADEKRLLRGVAAHALERLFAGASRDGVGLRAVSGYRSWLHQLYVYQATVNSLGEEEASRVSARPGHSEHQTGLAVDVTGADGSCAAAACFAGTPAARWLAAHAPHYGFIVRYPPGDEAVTGYASEPWHLRYLGVPLAELVARSGLTYDQFVLRDARRALPG